MHITLETIGIAILLVIVLESLMPALAPHTWQRMLAVLSTAPTKQIQKPALILLIATLALLLILSS